MSGPGTSGGVIPGKAAPRGRYSHIRRAGDFLYVSGTSSRRPDNTLAGVSVDASGATVLDVRAQTRAVLENIRDILRSAGAELSDIVQAQSFLVDMADFAGYNEVWAEFFGGGDGAKDPPTRTTVAARELPHPHLLIEINAVAYKPPPPPRETGFGP